MMYGWLRRLVLSAVLLLPHPLLHAFPEALEAQSVEGRVTSTEGTPVADARASLLDADFRTVAEAGTDAQGRYRVTAPDPGSYIVVVEVEGYPNQMSDPLSLTASGTVTHDVVLPGHRVGEADLSAADTLSDAGLLAAAIAEQCQDRFMAGIQGIIFGVVRDEATGTAIPHAHIQVSREDPTRLIPGSTQLDTRSDAMGIYLICTAPAREDLRIRGVAENAEGEWTTERLQAGMMRRVNLEVPLHDPEYPGSIVGKIQEQTGGQAIPGVTVTVKETDARVESDTRGNFWIPDLPWGDYTLSFDHPFYGHHEQTLSIIGGRSHDIDIYLPPQAIEMPPIIVRVRSRRWYGEMAGLRQRLDRGVGHIVLREEIEQRQPRNLGEALRGIPGVDVVQSGSGVSGRFVVRMRNAQTMLGQTCPPTIWVDGVRWRDTSYAYTEIQGVELEVLEVYNGPSQVPGEFLDSYASCGVIIVWTRRGRAFGG